MDRVSTKSDNGALDEIVRRIVDVAASDAIILFGSAAREDARASSDVDLLVVKSGGFDRGQLLGDIHEALYGVGRPVDVILVTPAELERYRDAHCLVVAPALREGREIYRASPLPA